MKTVPNLRSYDSHTPFVSVLGVERVHETNTLDVFGLSTYAVKLKDRNEVECIAYEEVDLANYFLNRSFPDALVMSAVKLGLGEKGVTELRDLWGPDGETLPQTIFVPLFVVNDTGNNPRVVCAEIILSTNKYHVGQSVRNYARAMMLVGSFGWLANGNTTNAEIMMDTADEFGEAEPVADLGYVSPDWTLELLINRSAIWWRDALLEVPDEVKLEAIGSCSARTHKREWNATFARDTTGKKLIEIAVTGKCPNCNAIEGAIAQDTSYF